MRMVQLKKLCPLCSGKGQKSELHAYQVNLEDVIYMCTSLECTYPLGSSEETPKNLIKRKLPDKHAVDWNTKYYVKDETTKGRANLNLISPERLPSSSVTFDAYTQDLSTATTFTRCTQTLTSTKTHPLFTNGVALPQITEASFNTVTSAKFTKALPSTVTSVKVTQALPNTVSTCQFTHASPSSVIPLEVASCTSSLGPCPHTQPNVQSTQSFIRTVAPAQHTHTLSNGNSSAPFIPLTRALPDTTKPTQFAPLTRALQDTTKPTQFAPLTRALPDTTKLTQFAPISLTPGHFTQGLSHQVGAVQCTQTSHNIVTIARDTQPLLNGVTGEGTRTPTKSLAQCNPTLTDTNKVSVKPLPTGLRSPPVLSRVVKTPHAAFSSTSHVIGNGSHFQVANKSANFDDNSGSGNRIKSPACDTVTDLNDLTLSGELNLELCKARSGIDSGNGDSPQKLRAISCNQTLCQNSATASVEKNWLHSASTNLNVVETAPNGLKTRSILRGCSEKVKSAGVSELSVAAGSTREEVHVSDRTDSAEVDPGLLQWVSKDAEAVSLREEVHASGEIDPGLLQWVNKDALCWLDVALALLVHARSLHATAAPRARDTLLGQVLDAHARAQAAHQQAHEFRHCARLARKGRAMAILTSIGKITVRTGGGAAPQKTLGPIRSALPHSTATSAGAVREWVMTPAELEERAAALAGRATELMEHAREQAWRHLSASLHCTKGSRLSPVLAVPRLLRAGGVEARAAWQYEWSMACSQCQHRHSDRQESLLASFPRVQADFHMSSPCLVCNCLACGAPGQLLRMRVLGLGDLVLAHFAEGLAGPLGASEFTWGGTRFALTAAVQHVTDPDHFIAWRRHHSGELWMKMDGLEGDRCSYTCHAPNVPPPQVHVLMWERQPAGSREGARSLPLCSGAAVSHAQPCTDAQVLCSTPASSSVPTSDCRNGEPGVGHMNTHGNATQRLYGASTTTNLPAGGLNSIAGGSTMEIAGRESGEGCAGHSSVQVLGCNAATTIGPPGAAGHSNTPGGDTVPSTRDELAAGHMTQHAGLKLLSGHAPAAVGHYSTPGGSAVRVLAGALEEKQDRISTVYAQGSEAPVLLSSLSDDPASNDTKSGLHGETEASSASVSPPLVPTSGSMGTGTSRTSSLPGDVQPQDWPAAAPITAAYSGPESFTRLLCDDSLASPALMLSSSALVSSSPNLMPSSQAIMPSGPALMPSRIEQSNSDFNEKVGGQISLNLPEKTNGQRNEIILDNTNHNTKALDNDMASSLCVKEDMDVKTVDIKDKQQKANVKHVSALEDFTLMDEKTQKYNDLTSLMGSPLAVQVAPKSVKPTRKRSTKVKSENAKRQRTEGPLAQPTARSSALQNGGVSRARTGSFSHNAPVDGSHLTHTLNALLEVSSKIEATTRPVNLPITASNKLSFEQLRKTMMKSRPFSASAQGLDSVTKVNSSQTSSKRMLGGLPLKKEVQQFSVNTAPPQGGPHIESLRLKTEGKQFDGYCPMKQRPKPTKPTGCQGVIAKLTSPRKKSPRRSRKITFADGLTTPQQVNGDRAVAVRGLSDMSVLKPASGARRGGHSTPIQAHDSDTLCAEGKGSVLSNGALARLPLNVTMQHSANGHVPYTNTGNSSQLNPLLASPQASGARARHAVNAQAPYWKTGSSHLNPLLTSPKSTGARVQHAVNAQSPYAVNGNLNAAGARVQVPGMANGNSLTAGARVPVPAGARVQVPCTANGNSPAAGARVQVPCTANGNSPAAGARVQVPCTAIGQSPTSGARVQVPCTANGNSPAAGARLQVPCAANGSSPALSSVLASSLEQLYDDQVAAVMGQLCHSLDLPPSPAHASPLPGAAPAEVTPAPLLAADTAVQGGEVEDSKSSAFDIDEFERFLFGAS